jgi:hypothetical protein
MSAELEVHLLMLLMQSITNETYQHHRFDIHQYRIQRLGHHRRMVTIEMLA